MHYKRLQKQRYPERVRARGKVWRAIKSGKLTKQPCSRCDAEIANAHHTDYSKPLDVVWMCKACHSREHVEHPFPRYISAEQPAVFEWRGRSRGNAATFRVPRGRKRAA